MNEEQRLRNEEVGWAWGVPFRDTGVGRVGRLRSKVIPIAIGSQRAEGRG